MKAKGSIEEGARNGNGNWLDAGPWQSGHRLAGLLWVVRHSRGQRRAILDDFLSVFAYIFYYKPLIEVVPEAGLEPAQRKVCHPQLRLPRIYLV